MAQNDLAAMMSDRGPAADGPDASSRRREVFASKRMLVFAPFVQVVEALDPARCQLVEVLDILLELLSADSPGGESAGKKMKT